jgi:hypothetical protein
MRHPEALGASMKTRLSTFRDLAIEYFHLEFSDRRLDQLLLQCPQSFAEKMDKVIRLHHRTNKPPADAAAFMARLLKPSLKFLIVGQADD